MKAYWVIAVFFGILCLGTIDYFSASAIVALIDKNIEISNSNSTTDATSLNIFKKTITDQISSDDSYKRIIHTI